MAENSNVMNLTQIGYLMCDNAKNNGTMLREFSQQIKRVTGIFWDPVEHRIK